MFHLGWFGIAALVGFGNLLPTFGIHYERVGKHLSKGSVSIDRDACHQRGLEPSAVLVGRFDVNISRPTQCRMPSKDSLMAHAGINPDIQCVAAPRKWLR